MRPPKFINPVEAREEQRRLAIVRGMSQASHDVLAERHRQLSVEDWTAEHDDSHKQGEMAHAAACYALHPLLAHFVLAGRPEKPERLLSLRDFWPWDHKWWKPKDRRRDLVRAAALIVAEIERIDRLNAVPQTVQGQS